MTRIYYPKFREMEIIKMNKTELVEAIASSTELTKTDVDKVVTALVEVVTDALAKGDKVSLVILKFVLVVKEQVETQELVKQ